MTTQYCLCPTSTRPKANAGGISRCGLPRAPKASHKPRKPNRTYAHKTREERMADHIDGYDRDDIGLSPDYEYLEDN